MSVLPISKYGTLAPRSVTDLPDIDAVESPAKSVCEMNAKKWVALILGAGGFVATTSYGIYTAVDDEHDGSLEILLGVGTGVTAVVMASGLPGKGPRIIRNITAASAFPTLLFFPIIFLNGGWPMIPEWDPDNKHVQKASYWFFTALPTYIIGTQIVSNALMKTRLTNSHSQPGALPPENCPLLESSLHRTDWRNLVHFTLEQVVKGGIGAFFYAEPWTQNEKTTNSFHLIAALCFGSVAASIPSFGFFILKDRCTPPKESYERLRSGEEIRTDIPVPVKLLRKVEKVTEAVCTIACGALFTIRSPIAIGGIGAAATFNRYIALRRAEKKRGPFFEKYDPRTKKIVDLANAVFFLITASMWITGFVDIARTQDLPSSVKEEQIALGLSFLVPQVPTYLLTQWLGTRFNSGNHHTRRLRSTLGQMRLLFCETTWMMMFLYVAVRSSGQLNEMNVAPTAYAAWASLGATVGACQALYAIQGLSPMQIPVAVVLLSSYNIAVTATGHLAT